MKNYLAVDIGGSKVLVGAVAADGKILSYERRDFSGAYSRKELLRDIYELSGKMMHFNPVACGVAVPGVVDNDRGILEYAPFTNIGDWGVAAEISDLIGLPVYAENDVNTCAIGEHQFGLCRKNDDFVWITLSNGVGGSIFIDGKLYTGKRFTAGEIGHIRVEANGKKCDCGNYGCLETVASGRAVSEYYKQHTGAEATAKEIAGYAKRGDEIALKAYERLARGLGEVMSNIINVLDIDTFILGGGLAADLDLYLPYIKEELNRGVFYKDKTDITIKYTALGFFASLAGCAAVAKKHRKLR